MARGTQLSALVIMLRAELGRSESVAVGISDRPRLVRAINRAYASLAAEHDWPHLRKTFTRITLSAGSRYYDFPSDLDYDRVEDVKLWWNSEPQPISRGISIQDYSAYDSTAATPERSDPALKWDIRWTGSREQIEIWPVPASTQYLQFTGFIKTPRLVNDSDLCKLDDDLVVLFAAARLVKDKDESRLVLAEANDKLNQLKSNSQSSSDTVRYGLGPSEEKGPPAHITIRVN